MKKKWIMRLAAAGLVCAAVAAGWFGFEYYQKHYVWMDGASYRRDAESADHAGKKLKHREKLLEFDHLTRLDLKGSRITAEDYDWIHENLPECQVIWDVPFQGDYVPMDTQTLQLEQLSEEDVAALDYLPNLAMVDAWDCRDYDQLLELEKRKPDCQVLYYVKLGETNWSRDWEDVTLNDVDAAELMEKLPLLPGVKRLHLTGELPKHQELEKMRKEFPNIEFSWDISFRGKTYAMDETYLDLTGKTITYDEAENLISLFDHMEYVNMKRTTLSQEELFALCEMFPDCFFLWDMELYGSSFSTDAEEIDISDNLVDDPAYIEGLLPLFPNLKKVVMCNCGIENEDMEAMNKRHDDVQFVWSARLGRMYFRTDITSFMPIKYGFSAGDYDLRNLIYFHDMELIDLGHQTLYKCEWAREMPNLRFVLLADTKVSDISPLADHKKLVYVELFLTYVKDTTPLVSCTALEDLNLCYTGADPEPLKQMMWLKRLWFSGNWLAEKTLADELPNTQKEFHSASSTGNGWRQGKLYFEQRDILGLHYMTA